MTISTEILRDLISNSSIDKAVYYIPERSLFVKTTESANMGDCVFIKTPSVEDHQALTKKLFRQRVGRRNIPTSEMLNIFYHLPKGDLHTYLEANNLSFLYQEVEFRAVFVLFQNWIKENNINMQWFNVEIEEDC